MSGAVTIRMARGNEQAAIAVIAELDCAKVPHGPLLLAESGSEIVAAISLRDGAVVANPFRPTADIVELLRARERQLRSVSRRRGLRARVAIARLRAPALG